MPIEIFTHLQSNSLFLPTPLVETPPNEQSSPSIKQISKLLTTVSTSSDLTSRELYRQFIHISDTSRALIFNLKLQGKKEVLELYELWEIRLTSLIFANELSIAQKEAKRLSVTFDDLIPKLHQYYKKESPDDQNKAGTDKSVKDDFTIPHQYSNFPNETPFSLRFLIVRLRAVGPGKLMNEEYFKQLWFTRYLFNNHSEFKTLSQKIIKVIYWGLSSSLIAKREYFTFLTNTENLLNSYNEINETDETTEVDKLAINFKNRVLFLSALINLVIGESEVASKQYERVEKEELKDIVLILETLLNSINPVLDRKNSVTQESTEKDESEKVHLTSEPLSIDDLFELVKNQLITGRIICALCASFELELRDFESKDLLNNNIDHLDDDYKEVQELLFNLWKAKTYKLHAYE